MPQLNPESMSMIGLNLFQQLSHLSKITNASCENPLSEDQVSSSSDEPRHEKTGFLHMQKQKRRSASR